MPDPLYLISRWWKQMLALLIITLAIVSAIVFTRTPTYLSTSTALPANAGITDKGSIFNNNIQEIYSALGSSDDVDRLVGTAQLDTIYLAVTDRFNLFDHYKINDPAPLARFRSSQKLRKRSRVFKSEYGELRIKVWDTDKHLAPQLADALMESLGKIHQDMQSESNRSVLMSLEQGRSKILDSLSLLQHTVAAKDPASRDAISSSARQTALMAQLAQYEQLIGQYQLMVDRNPAMLRIVEKARVAEFPDQPKPILVIGVAAGLSLIFAFCLALILERRKRALA